MSDPVELITVYRSMDANAKDDCEVIVEILTAQGLSPVIVDDSVPGVLAGTFEVRVPSEQVLRAEEIVAENPLPDEVEEVDTSADLDLVTVFQAQDTLAESESLEIKRLLEANGINAVLVGNSVLPILSFEVRVARDQFDRAREVLNEAEAAGPQAAEEAEAILEAEGNPPGAQGKLRNEPN